MQNMFDRLGFPVFRMRLKQVRNMQKAGSLKPNVHESALHTRQNPYHSSEINIPDQALGADTFYEQILKNTISHHGHSGFSRSEID